MIEYMIYLTSASQRKEVIGSSIKELKEEAEWLAHDEEFELEREFYYRSPLTQGFKKAPMELIEAIIAEIEDYIES